MIRAIFILLPLHSVIAQFDAWNDGGQSRLAVFCIFGTMINLALLVNWAQNTHYETIDTPANAVWSFLDLLGFYVVAASHPFFYYPKGEFFVGAPVMEFSHVSLRWIGFFQQSGTDFLLTLYATSLLGILTAAMFVLAHGIYIFVFHNIPKQNTKNVTVKEGANIIQSEVAKDIEAIADRVEQIEQNQYRILHLRKNNSRKAEAPDHKSKFTDDNPLSAFKDL